MIEVPEKIFERSIDNIEIGISDIYLYSKEEIDEGQIGYRIDDKENKIEDWIGDNYIVIGHDSCCGDPIIIDTFDKDLPVYSMFHDDWDSLQKIANSFEQFIEILNMIDETDISDEEEKDNIIAQINDMVPENDDYWDSLIQVAYEFLNDLD